MPVLYFDAPTHTYSLDGRVVPGVTAILKQAGIIDDTWFNPEARDRGTAIHQAIHWHEHGSLDNSSIDSRIMPYFAAYLEFRKLAGFVPIHSEKILYCHRYDFACRIDVFGRFHDGVEALIEFKTGVRPKWVDIQLAGQQQACIDNGLHPTRLYSLELRGNGRFDLRQHKAHDALHFFLGARQKVKELQNDVQ